MATKYHKESAAVKKGTGGRRVIKGPSVGQGWCVGVAAGEARFLFFQIRVQ